MTIVHAVQNIAALKNSVKKQHEYIASELNDVLESARQTNDGSLDESDFKKITHYYGLAVPAILGNSLGVLRGFGMTKKERLTLTYQGAMTGLFDDFFDKYNLHFDDIKSFLDNPDKKKGSSSAEKLFLTFYKNALEYAAKPVVMVNYLRKVYEAQIESKKQAAPGLTQDEILDITLKKGGLSVLFYRASMIHPFEEGEEEALMQMGGLMQFGNDIFDIYKDRNNHIQTLLTTTKHIAPIRKLFTAQQEKCFSLIKQLDYELKNKKKCLQLIAMSLCARCYVCLDQLENNETTSQNLFAPEQYDREQLVCDMDKTRNKINTIKYFLKQRI